MAKRIEIGTGRSLDRHAEYAHLAQAVAALRDHAATVARRLDGRTVWMINSTARGGGVSEMLPGMITHLRELGIRTEWLVIEAHDDRFFPLTKRIHNMLHGRMEADPTAAERQLYESTNRGNVESMLRHVKPHDILVVHDPQPMPLAGMLSAAVPLTTVWRCHIGLDEHNDATRSAWAFLEPYAGAYDHAIFSAPEYVPAFLAGRSSVIHPALDPLTAKNRPLHVQSVVEILERAGLVPSSTAPVAQPFVAQARRLQADGSFAAAIEPDPIDLLRRPIITQVSRWDRLKGFLPLMRAFARFRRGLRQSDDGDARSRRLLMARLVLAGPDPASVADDPEGVDVFDELSREYRGLPDDVRSDIAILALPMADPEQNALIVNALQRVSTIVAQNSIREGFGLTITEAMWKGVPVLTNSAACGPRQQVRDGIDGRIISDPHDTRLLADTIGTMISDLDRLDAWGRGAQRRVHDRFLIYNQLREWLALFERLA